MNKITKRDSINNRNLVEIAQLISGLDYLIFFGTLLGIVRSKSLIEGDDDIDFIINKKDFSKLKKLLKDNGYIITHEKIDYISFNKKSISEEHTIDFYGFEINEEFIWLNESFYDNCLFKLDRHKMKIPKDIIFKTITNELNIKIPKHPKKVLEYIYGEKWEIYLKKNKEYFIFFKKNIPVITYNKVQINFLYFLRLIAEGRIVAARRLLFEKTGVYRYKNLFRDNHPK